MLPVAVWSAGDTMLRNTAGAVLISIGILLIAAALAFTGYNLWDDDRAGREAGNVLDVLESLTPNSYDTWYADPEVQPGETENSAVGGTEEPDDLPIEIPDYVLNPDMEMPTVEIDGDKYIGMIEIPSIEIKLPIMDAWDEIRSKIAPARYAGSAYSGGLILCGHNYARHFGRLKNREIDDVVIFTDVDGNVFRYKVKKIEIIDGTAVEEMISGDWDLTLFTCAIPARLTRVTIRCMLDDGE